MAVVIPSITLRWLAAHHNVITTRVLRAHGIGDTATMRLVERNVLRRVARGVFVAAAAPSTLEQRCAIASAKHPNGFVTGPTAGMLAGIRRMPVSAPLHFSVLHGVHLETDPGIRYRQTTNIKPIDRWARDDGIVVASWPRLAFDLAADLRPLDHLSAVQQLIHERRISTEELVAIDQRLGHPARPGSGTFRRSLLALGDHPANESHPEVVLADALRRRDVPVEHQAKVLRLRDARLLRIDLAVPAARWGIELDIHPEHRTVEGAGRDARRRRDMHLVGWQVETVTEVDMADVEALADDLLTLYVERCRNVGIHPSVVIADAAITTLRRAQTLG